MRAADGLAVAGVVVGAEDAELGVAGRHAALELLEAPLVDRAERLDVLIASSISSFSSKTPGGVEPPSRALQARASPLGHGVSGPGGSCTHDVSALFAGATTPTAGALADSPAMGPCDRDRRRALPSVRRAIVLVEIGLRDGASPVDLSLREESNLCARVRSPVLSSAELRRRGAVGAGGE